MKHTDETQRDEVMCAETKALNAFSYR